jgi:hypothetical protein
MDVPWQQKLNDGSFDESLVRVVRRFGRASDLEGFVVRHGEEALVLLAVDSYRFCGFTVIRTRDTTDLRPAAGARDEFVRLALDVQGFPRTPPPWEGDDFRDALKWSIDSRPSLVSVSKEDTTGTALFVGMPTELTQRSAKLKEIASDGRWLGRTHSHRLSEITRLDVGGPYESVLMAVNQRRRASSP